MTIDNLQCFISLAECLNFTKAAEKEHMTQTSMSRKITGMEDELGVLLFERNNHQVSLTPAGKELYRDARILLHSYSRTVERTQNVHHGYITSIRIGLGNYEHELLGPFLKEYARQNPSLRFSCYQYPYPELSYRFQQNYLDLILTTDKYFRDMPVTEIKAGLVFEDDWKIGVCAASPLAQKEVITAEDLSSQTFITMTDGSISQILDRYKILGNFKDIIQVNSHATKLMMIGAGLGVGTLPPFISSGENVILKSFEKPYQVRKFYIICRKDNPNVYIHDFYEKFLKSIDLE